MKRPTQRDIAKLAKVSHVTVSLALRGHRKIPKATRDRIEAIAKEIGYRPDPGLSALTRYCRTAKPSSYQGALAWINAYQHPEKLAEHFFWYHCGARERCAELGYNLDEFRMVDLDMNFGRLSKVLRARNIQGVLFPPQDKERRHITKANFDWDDFSSIAFGFSLMRPKLDVVSNAQFRSTRIAVRNLRSLGYRRIGMVVSRQASERHDQNFLGGFLVEQRRFAASDHVPIHIILEQSAADSERRFRKWLSRNTPDAILAVTWFDDWYEVLRTAGPKGCGLAVMDVPEGNTRLSGINQNNLIIGRTSVDMLVAKIYANQRGIPSAPLRILVEGHWVAGTTAPRISRQGCAEIPLV